MKMIVRNQKEKKSPLKSMPQMENMFLLMEKVNLGIQGEPRGLGNGLAEQQVGFDRNLHVYMAPPKGELLLSGMSSFSRYW